MRRTVGPTDRGWGIRGTTEIRSRGRALAIIGRREVHGRADRRDHRARWGTRVDRAFPRRPATVGRDRRGRSRHRQDDPLGVRHRGRPCQGRSGAGLARELGRAGARLRGPDGSPGWPEGTALDALEPPRRRALELALGPSRHRVGRRRPGSSGSPCSTSSGRLPPPGRSWSRSMTSSGATRRPREPSHSPRAGCAMSQIAFVFASRTVSPPRPPSELETALPVERRVRVPLGPLTIGALGRLVHDRLGVTHPRPLLVRVHDACAGNPFVALEMSRCPRGAGRPAGAGRAVPGVARGGAARPRPPGDTERAGTTGPRGGGHVVAADDRAPRAGHRGPRRRRPWTRRAGPGSSSRRARGCARPTRSSPRPATRTRRPASDGRSGWPSPTRPTIRSSGPCIARRPSTRPDPAVAGELEDAADSALVRGAPGVAADLFERAAGLVSDPDRRAELRIRSAGARYRAGDAEGADALLRATLLDVATGPTADGRPARPVRDRLRHEPRRSGHRSSWRPWSTRRATRCSRRPCHSYIGGMADADPAAYARSAVAALAILERLGVRARSRPPRVRVAGAGVLVAHERPARWPSTTSTGRSGCSPDAATPSSPAVPRRWPSGACTTPAASRRRSRWTRRSTAA